MRITVESAGFTQAADACRAANEIAAITTETLAGKLGHYAGMAGNDSTSTAFAESYDDAAGQALATLTELTHAFIGLGRLIDATGDNHRAAENASAGRDGRGGTKSRHETRGWSRVSPADPPSSLGGQEPSLGTIDQWILDHVEGFAWPGADTGLLRDAATTWRSAASSIDHLDHHLDDIAALLSRQRSPEIPLALAVLDNVRTLITDTATHLADLGQACDDYSTAVEAAHDRTRALLAEIGQMIIEGAALSVLATAITGGLGGGAAATAAISRITTQAPRFHTILTTLRTIATTSATRARTARNGLRDIRTRAEKLARIGARDERGSMKNPLGWGPHRKPSFESRQVKRKFKHAPAFGVNGPYNAANAQRFEDALVAFLSKRNVISKEGTMRGQPGKVVFHYDPVSRQCVVTSPGGSFVSGWILNPKQLAGVIEKGHLGGA